jgi:hypothetical protein
MKGGTMRRSALLAALLLVGCGRTAETSLADGATPSLAAAATLESGAPAVDAGSAEQPDAAPSRTTVAAHVASFAKGSVLDECVDYRVTGTLTSDAGADPDSQLAAQVLTSMKVKNKELLRVYKPCEEQFHSSDLLASCKVHSTQPVPREPGVDGGTFDLDIVARYYDLATLEANDVEMKQCLSVKGDWQGLDKTSEAYKNAVQARGRK